MLFLCTDNSARSQMAEGLLRRLAGNRFEIHGAGTEATSIRPAAVLVMAEIGVNISGQESKTLERYLGERFEYVITVCDDANEACPVFPGRRTACTGRTGDMTRGRAYALPTFPATKTQRYIHLAFSPHPRPRCYHRHRVRKA